jgi:hypothetical protein
MKRAEFSTLSFTNSLEVNYFGQIADVVVPAGATPDTILLLLVCTVADFSVIVSLPPHLPRQKFDKWLRKAMVH